MFKLNYESAKLLFNEGMTIYLLPCKVEPLKDSLEPKIANKRNKFSLDEIIKSYRYNVCNEVLGAIPSFYIV
jgi:hypothetical protein